MSKLEAFRRAEWDQQVRMIADPETAREVEHWLGPLAFAEFKTLQRDASHLGRGKKNLILVPGVMGSMLQSEGMGGIWWADMLRARDKLDSLALAPGGLTDANPSVEVSACAIDIIYAPLRAAIAQSSQFGGSVQFPYDWRKPLAASARQLANLIHKAHADYGEPVHLVGHSMGGLMIRTTLMLHGVELWPKIGKIVFLATPHYGAVSIAGYLKNHLWGWEPLAVIGAYLSRETFRSMWGVLSLLPAPASIYPGTRDGQPHPCANFDLYNASAYQLDLDAVDTISLQRCLDAVREMHVDLFNWHTYELMPAQRRRMLQISGVGRKTLFRLQVPEKWNGSWRDVDKVTRRTANDPDREGDGRVPLSSAGLERVEQRFVKGEHGSLQNLPDVVKDMLAWIGDRQLSLPDSPRTALSSHLSGCAPTNAPHLDGSFEFSAHDDEYARYQELPESRIKQLIVEMEKGSLPFKIDLARIL